MSFIYSLDFWACGLLPLLSDKIVLAFYLFSLLWTLSLSSHKAIDAVSSGALIPATVILSIAVLVSASNISASSFSSY